MKRIDAGVAVLVLGLLVCPARAQDADTLPTPPEGKTWKMVWHDEFEGTKLDESKWEIPPDGKRRDAWWMRKAVSLDGEGHLVVSTLKEDGKYIDGCVRVYDLMEKQ